MKCPLKYCNKLFTDKEQMYSHVCNCILTSGMSKTHRVCNFNPQHLVSNEKFVEHLMECKDHEDLKNKQEREINKRYRENDSSLINDKKEKHKENNYQDESFYQSSNRHNNRKNKHNFEDSMIGGSIKKKEIYSKFNPNDSLFQSGSNHKVSYRNEESINTSKPQNKKITKNNKNVGLSIYEKTTRDDQSDFVDDSMSMNPYQKQKKDNSSNWIVSKSKINESIIDQRRNRSEIEVEDSIMVSYSSDKSNNFIEEDISNENKKEDSDSLHQKDLIKEKNAMNETLNETFAYFNKIFSKEKDQSQKTVNANTAPVQKVEQSNKEKVGFQNMMQFLDDLEKDNS